MCTFISQEGGLNSARQCAILGLKSLRGGGAKHFQGGAKEILIYVHLAIAVP